MSLEAIGAVAGTAGSIFQLVSGISDTQRGKSTLSKLGERPAYITPQAIGGATTVAQNLAQEGLPQSSINTQRDLLERRESNMLQGLSDRRSGLVGLTSNTQSLADAYTQMALADAQAKLTNQQNYQQQLNLLGQYQEKELLDEQGNYDVKRAEALGLLKGGQQRIDTSIQSFLNVAPLLTGATQGVGGQ